MIDQGQSQSPFPIEKLSATEIGLLTRRAEPADSFFTLFTVQPQGQYVGDMHQNLVNLI